MENFTLKNNLRITNTKSKDLRKILGKGEIYPANILNKISETSFLIEILSRQIIAASSLQFTTAKVFVQINELDPKIHLRIISSNLEYIEQILDIAKSEQIKLDTFNQWGLAEFIKTGYTFSDRRIKDDLNKIKMIASGLNSRHLIPLAEYVKMLSKKPFRFYRISSVLFPKPIPVKSSKKGYIAANRPGDIINTLHYYYTHYNFDSKNLKTTLKKDGLEIELSEIENICSVLKEYNDFMKPNYSLSGFLVPCENEIKPVTVEGKRDIKGADIINRFEFTFSLENYGSFRINLRFLEKMLSILYFFYNTLLNAKLIEFEQPARAIASTYGLKVLPFHHEMSYYRTIL